MRSTLKGLKNPELSELSQRIGDFMKYWGFRKIDGMVWAHIFLSPQPLSASEVAARLQVSKALVSLSIKELLRFEVIIEEARGAGRTVLYRSAENLATVIQNVLRTRELRMLTSLEGACRELKSTLHRRKGFETVVDAQQMQTLSEMIAGARGLLENLFSLGELIPALEKQTA